MKPNDLKKPDEPSNIVPSGVTKSKTQDLMDLIMEDHDLGLDPEQMAKFEAIKNKHVVLQPGRLRICHTPVGGKSDCPMHDSCPYITQIDPPNRPYNRRCPFEAELYTSAFEQQLEFVRSMDPDYDPAVPYNIPAIEQGLCQDLAFQTVVEHRLSLSIADSPGATQIAPVPGAAGATKKEENPAYNIWAKAVEKRARYQDKLQKTVEARLKRIHQKQENRELTVEAIRRKFQESTRSGDSVYKKFFEEADKATVANAELTRSKFENKPESDGEAPPGGEGPTGS